MIPFVSSVRLKGWEFDGEVRELGVVFRHFVDAGQLSFLRTAQVAEQQYWIWGFQEADGSPCYITVAVSPDGSSCLGYDENHYGLTPEQFMLGDDHQVF
jgi:hypothetical protein